MPVAKTILPQVKNKVKEISSIFRKFSCVNKTKREAAQGAVEVWRNNAWEVWALRAKFGGLARGAWEVWRRARPGSLAQSALEVWRRAPWLRKASLEEPIGRNDKVKEPVCLDAR